MTVLRQVIADDDMENITKQFTRLKDHCYLDNAGAALYPESLIRAVSDDFTGNIYMNPHSDIHSQECIDDVRNLILQHFHTDASEYSVVFTSGATQALRLVAESFRFCPENERGAFVHLRDNHTSVLGLRELVKIGVDIYYVSHDDFVETLGSDTAHIERREKTSNALLVYPAQNNYNGYKYSIDCMDNIRNGCLNKFVPEKSCDWHILLDAASFVSTSDLDLSVVKPDFVCLSFYKIFGYPTGLGALLVKNDSIPLLSEKKYYGGGTVDTVLNSDTFFARKKELTEGFEDGTISFLSIMALKHCFNTLNNFIPKTIKINTMETISQHTYSLAKLLYNRLKDLKHPNGEKAIVFYMDTDFTDIKKQGGIVTFNIIRENGSFVGYNEFNSKSVSYKISVRTGCFCNSGSCQRHFRLSNKEIRDRYEAGHKCGGETDLIDGVPTGAVRVSFGYYNTTADVDNIMNMITESYVIPKTAHKKPIPKEFVKPYAITQILCEDNTTEQNYFDPPKKYTKTLKEIMIYPIEHCGPYTIKSNWRLSSEGLGYNKAWKVITTDGTILNENSKRLLSKISPDIDLSYNNMTLHYPGTSSIYIPLDEYIVYSSISVDKDTIEHDCGDKIAKWISNVANCPNLRLVKVIRNHRNSDPFESLSKMIVMTNYINPVDDIFNPKNIKANIVVDLLPESFTGDWDRVVIGNHEFKVEGYYAQSLKINAESDSEIALNQPKICSKDLVLAVYLSYVRCLNGCNNTLEINSQVKLLRQDAVRSEMEDKISTKDSNYPKESKSCLKQKLNLLFSKRKKFEVTAL